MIIDENGYGPAFLEGREAFKNGMKEKDCPYDIHGEWGDWADWTCGWGREWCESDINDYHEGERSDVATN